MKSLNQFLEAKHSFIVNGPVNTVLNDKYRNKSFVDLGLSVKWATCNVGSNDENKPGDYFNFEESKEYNCPTQAQAQELLDNTTHERIGNVFKLTSKKYPDRYIIFPCGGFKEDDGSLSFSDYASMVWTNNIKDRNSSYVLSLSGRHGVINNVRSCVNDSNIQVREIKK